MIVSKGWGLATIVVPLVISWSAEYLFDSYFGDHFYKESTWAMPGVFVLSAIVIALLGYKLNSKPGRILIDPETSEEVELKERHTLYGIAMQYWSVVLFAIAAWIYADKAGWIYH